MSITIRTFADIASAEANQNSRRIIISDAQAGALRSPDDTRTWKFFCFAKRFDSRNAAVRQEFADAMTREFGAHSGIGRDFVSAAPLSARIIRDAVRDAAEMRNAMLAAARANIAPVAANMTAHVRERLAARYGYGVEKGIQGTTYHSVLAAYNHSPIAAMDARAGTMVNSAAANDVAAVARVDAAIAGVAGYPDAHCLPVYREFMRTALLNIDLHNVPEANRQNILNSLAADLAKQLGCAVDQTIRHVLSKADTGAIILRTDPHRDGKVSQIATKMAENPALYYTRYPGLLDILETRTQFFVANINTMMNRIATQAQRAAACNRCKSGGAPDMDAPVLTDVKLTGSDPHNGGQRVMIATFHDDAAGVDRKVVYKPRDCRVDEKICGRGREGFASVASVMNARIGGEREAIPTYSYLTLADAAGEHYGFVQHLAHEPADYTVGGGVAPEQFYTDMGRHMALNALCGLTDMHQGNYIVSGGRPYATDLEMAFNHGVFKDGGASVSIPMTMIDKALSRSTEGDFVSITHHPDVATQNFLKDGDVTVRYDDYRNCLRNGFKEVLLTAKAADCNAQLRHVFNEFDQMHVRLHPLATSDQLRIRNSVENEPNELPRTYVDSLVARRLDAAYRDVSLDVTFRAPACSRAFYMMARKDWSVGDVAYFTRKLSRQPDPDGSPIYHNGKSMNTVRQNDANDGVPGKFRLRDDGTDVEPFRFDGLVCALRFLDSLPQKTEAEIDALLPAEYKPPAQ